MRGPGLDAVLTAVWYSTAAGSRTPPDHARVCQAHRYPAVVECPIRSSPMAQAQARA
ncbi:Uncharacterised protein [Mycobacteroides abscessus subsp. abscessus]|nr:Uncharacterised protein [Mycobacteroides abscessus subsp. abscessus]